MRSRLSSSTILLILKCVCVYNFPAKRFIKSGKIQIARGSLNKAKKNYLHLWKSFTTKMPEFWNFTNLSNSKKEKKKLLSFVFETTSSLLLGRFPLDFCLKFRRSIHVFRYLKGLGLTDLNSMECDLTGSVLFYLLYFEQGSLSYDKKGAWNFGETRRLPGSK